MNKTLLLVASLLLGTFVAGAQDAAVMTFEFEKHDFGNVKEGEEASVDFTLTNTGTKNLIILDVVGSCSCTSSSWPKEPVLPGEKTVIRASYDTKGKSGTFNKSLTITSNASEEVKRIFIKGNVISNGESTRKNPEKSSSPIADE